MDHRTRARLKSDVWSFCGGGTISTLNTKRQDVCKEVTESMQDVFKLNSPKIIIPMIRRTFPELITNEIVGVQPICKNHYKKLIKMFKLLLEILHR